MSRAATVLVLVSACAASATALREDADRDNPRARAAALAHFTRGRELIATAPPVVGQGPPYGEVTGTPLHDGLVSLPDGTLGFVEQGCAVGDSCGCDVGAEYHYWRDGAKLVIATLLPDVEVHTVKRAGTCGQGCGVQAPPPPSTVRGLGALAPADVEVEAVHYHYDQVVETCDHPMPLP